MNAQTQPVKANRLDGKDQSHREEFSNHALAGLQVLEGKVRVAVDTPPPAGDGAEAAMTDVVRAVTEEAPQNDNGGVTAEMPAAIIVAVAPAMEETPRNEGGVDPAAEVHNSEDRRSQFHSASRALVSAPARARAQATFTVAPLMPLEPEQGTRKAKQPLPKDAPWERVTLGVFKRNKNAEMLSLVREIHAKGARPVMTMEIRAPEGVGTRVDFGLSIAVEKGAYEHVKLTPLDGAGLFGWLFQNGVEVFHDEVVGEKPASPDRYLATVGVNSAVNMVDSFLASIRAARQQR
jgi:hypothetical protein